MAAEIPKYERRDGRTAGAHYIEEAVSVYLMRHPDRDAWVIDPLTVDGCALDSTHDEYPSNAECRCQHEYPAPACDAARDRMTDVGLPSGHELLELLADTLGYQLIAPPTPAAGGDGR